MKDLTAMTVGIILHCSAWPVSEPIFYVGKEGHLAKNCFGGSVANLRNQQSCSTRAGHPTQKCQSHPPARAYASTSKHIGNLDAVVICTLFFMGHIS